MTTVTRTYEAQVSAEGEWLSVTQVCRASQIDFDVVIELAELGLVTPRGSEPKQWQVSTRELVRLRTAARLMRDLGVNVTEARRSQWSSSKRGASFEGRLASAFERCLHMSDDRD